MTEQNNLISVETKIEKSIRKFKLFVPLITLMAAAFFYWLILYCHIQFAAGSYWTIIPASFFAHSFLILTIHEASHRNITRTNLDRFILNVASAIVFVPFYGEHYRKYHLTHHGNTNTLNDPISQPVMRKLYERNRYLYILFEFIPFLYTFYVILNYEKKKRLVKINSPSIHIFYFILSTMLSILMFIILKPNIWFLLGTLFLLNILATIRNWCEHMGTYSDRSSNTYWFPLGMGIGNHDLHHQKSSYSWFSLMIGLYFKPIDTNPIKCLKGILFDKTFTFYDK